MKNRPFRLVRIGLDESTREPMRYRVETKVKNEWVDAGTIYKTPQGNWMFTGSGGPAWRATAEEAGQAKADDWYYN